MNTIYHRLTLLLSLSILAGCASPSTNDATSQGTAKTPDSAKPTIRVEATLLTYDELKSIASKNDPLNDRLKKLAPEMAYDKSQVENHFVLPWASIAGFATQEIVNWIGTLIDDEAKKHSAQFAAQVQKPDWWDSESNAPRYAAVELTRTKIDGKGKEILFDAIVIIRPFLTKTSAVPAAFQLIPVYLIETAPAAEDFGRTMGAVLSIQLESTWNLSSGDPKDAILANYTVTVKSYDLKKPYLFTKKDLLGVVAAAETSDDDQAEYSHFFAMPLRSATIAATFGVAETDPSKWVGLLEKLGTAIKGQSSNAGSAVKKELTPASSTTSP
jgi:hypothetical protein